jgi:thymidylate kinase
MMGPLFVEFIGPPGAGKTTIAKEVVNLLEAKGYRAVRRPRLDSGPASHFWHSARLFWFRVTNPRLVLAALRFVLSVKPRRFSRWRYVPHLLFRAYHRSEMRKTNHQVVLFCQAFMQTTWSATLDSDGFDQIELDRLFQKIYGEVGGTTLFVLVDVDAATAAERVVNRPIINSRFDRLPYDEVERSLSRHGATFRTLVETAAKSAGSMIHHVDGSRPVDDTADEVANHIEDRLRGGNPRARALPRSAPASLADPKAEMPA